jgi:hypothetical protein
MPTVRSIKFVFWVAIDVHNTVKVVRGFFLNLPELDLTLDFVLGVLNSALGSLLYPSVSN